MSWLAISLALGAAAIYALMAMLTKRVTRGGADVWRITFGTLVVAAGVFQVLWLLPGPPFAWSLFAVAAGPGLLLLIGQIFAVLALQKGDVSVAAPLMGMKVILVAALAVLMLGEPVGWAKWTGAILAAVAVALLRGGNGARHGPIGLTILLALISSLLFAATDVLTQLHGQAWGATRLGPAIALWYGVGACALIPLFEKNKPSLLQGSYRFLLAAGLCFGVQAILLTILFADMGQATGGNIVYASRGVWSILMAWMLGPMLGIHERDHGPAVLLQRLTAATLLIAAIALVVLE